MSRHIIQDRLDFNTKSRVRRRKSAYRFVMDAKLGPCYHFKKFFKGPITTWIINQIYLFIVLDKQYHFCCLRIMKFLRDCVVEHGIYMPPWSRNHQEILIYFWQSISWVGIWRYNGLALKFQPWHKPYVHIGPSPLRVYVHFCTCWPYKFPLNLMNHVSSSMWASPGRPICPSWAGILKFENLHSLSQSGQYFL